jgi:hypothetical protein
MPKKRAATFQYWPQSARLKRTWQLADAAITQTLACLFASEIMSGMHRYLYGN